jgi:hypothetical protein
MPSTIQSDLRRVGKFVEICREGSIRHKQFFRLALKSSLAKCYDLTRHVYLEKHQSPPFFLVPSLRGICEDIIVLGFMQRMTATERNDLIANLMILEVDEATTAQASFFKRARPHQPVLSPSAGVQARIAAVETASRAIWSRHGWNLSRGAMPQVRQLAERQGQPVLSILYEYLYALTSGMVHFRPGVLLRLGWGSPTDFVFGVKQFEAYDRALVQIYSLYLLCIYFETFARAFRPPQEVRDAVVNLREHLLLEERWPEMVTFEEMNLKPPRFSVTRLLWRFAQARMAKRRRLLR